MVFQPQRPAHFQPNRIQQGPNQLFSMNQRIIETSQPSKIQQMVQRFVGHNASVPDIASKGVNGISKTLSGVQQVLKVVETTAPIVKQYGPMVKNLPAMFKMMKALKEADGTDDEVTMESTDDDINIGSPEPSIEDVSQDIPKKNRKNGQSTPKLFI